MEATTDIHNITEPRHRVQPLMPDLEYIKFIEYEILQLLPEVRSPLLPILNHIFTSGGKRLRPFLAIRSGQCFKPGIPTKLIKTAISFELIHMASLIHDDIIDRSDTRHGKPAVNKIWGSQCAVLSGDYLFAKALEILYTNKLLDCLDLAIYSIEQMCEGEIHQYQHKFNTGIGIEEYFDRIYRKTACLISCCCKCGALVSGASDEEIEALDNYGLNIGYAFQITDDILDLTGCKQLLGKPVGQDLVQGEVTLPVILLNQHEKYRRLIDSAVRPDCSSENLAALIDALYKSGSIEKAYSIASLHVEKAKSCLESIAPSESRAQLYETADKILQRSV